MARLRKIEISHFRAIDSLSWYPSSGLNCLIGPGDSGKSTILDAIDLCLKASRSSQFNDTDFFGLDTSKPISITLTIGDLDDDLKNIDSYGQYLRGFDSKTRTIDDEPEQGLETVLSLNLTVNGDLEPVWTLISDRARDRDLSWGDRRRIAPTRIGSLTGNDLGWRKGSVLHRLTDEKADASAALAQAARDARARFGDDAEKQVEGTLRLVEAAAEELGIDVGNRVRALIDAQSITFGGGGTISLHDEYGIPLTGLGIGSSRLLIAGLHRKAAAKSTMLLIDELEHGLEPHRIIRFLGSLGAKEAAPPLQAFLTTHSPVALRELSASQLIVLREADGTHVPILVGDIPEIQGTIRSHPDAFLARSVLICEGASEVGLIRGIDQYYSTQGAASIFASGVSLVDAGGESKLLKAAEAFKSLGYRVAILRDDDVQPDATSERAFVASGGLVVMWQGKRKLEQELFESLPVASIGELLERAVLIRDADTLDNQIKSASLGALTLAAVRAEIASNSLSVDSRKALGVASSGKSLPWFKTVTAMEEIGRDIVGPILNKADPNFKEALETLFSWATDE